jgi:sugar phosphate isomerase/epimerase
MNRSNQTCSGSDRRAFLRSAGGRMAAGLFFSSTASAAQSQGTDRPEFIANSSAFRPLTDEEKVERIASNSYPIRWLFKTHNTANSLVGDREMVAKMKSQYGEITMLDFPEFTKKTFPGVTKMDIWSSLFGDADDDSQYVSKTITGMDGKPRNITEFDPSSTNGKKWLDKMAAKLRSTGTKVHHISNNAPRDLCDLDKQKRMAGIEVAKVWLDGAAVLGTKSMRVNSGGPRVASPPLPNSTGYPTNEELEKYLTVFIESMKELADYGSRVGVKVTLENHWGLTANPINIRIIIEEVNNVFCEASPDFCNWEHKYLLYHALNDLAPYAHTNVHAKFWNRMGQPDVQRNVRIMLNHNYDGVFALEYEEGPWDGVEGAQYLYREVMAAL